MRERSTQRPPRTATIPPSTAVPVPKGTIGTWCAGTYPGDLGYFRNACGESHGLRRLRRVVGGVGRVGAAHFRGRIQARAEERTQGRQSLGVYGVHGPVICPMARRVVKKVDQ